MITSFGNQGTSDIFHAFDTKAARKTCPKSIWPVAVRKLETIHRASKLSDLGLPGLNLEKLKGSFAGYYSVRVNEKYRVIFMFSDGPPAAASEVEIVDYH